MTRLYFADLPGEVAEDEGLLQARWSGFEFGVTRVTTILARSASNEEASATGPVITSRANVGMSREQVPRQR